MTATALAVAITAGMCGLWFGWTVGTMWATWTSERRTPVSASSEHLFDGPRPHSVALRGMNDNEGIRCGQPVKFPIMVNGVTLNGVPMTAYRKKST